MADIDALRKQIMDQLFDYSYDIICGTKTVINELRNGRETDTEELFNLVIQGINWEIEVFNNCEDTLNSETQYVDKAHRVNKSRMASAVGRLGKILPDKDDVKLAACLEVDFLPFLKSMKEAAEAY